jgi:hypothetical protein
MTSYYHIYISEPNVPQEVANGVPGSHGTRCYAEHNLGVAVLEPSLGTVSLVSMSFKLINNTQ